MEKDSVNKEYYGKIPVSTYRLQLNRFFKFKDAEKIVPYLNDLGISHIYISPILLAKTGSLHGYDITDHSKLNPEIGTEKDFDRFCSIVEKNNMGIILDIVPNHMGLGSQNKWWMDVLENGQASEYADYFDIDWTLIKNELSGKVLMPVLGDHYGNVLINSGFYFIFDGIKGQFKLIYGTEEFPINPSSYPLILEYKINKLEFLTGKKHNDFLEYQSIITALKNLPDTDESSAEKIKERNREKEIAFKRLALLYKKNKIISAFIREKLNELKCQPDKHYVCERVHNILEAQPYRLAYWRVSADMINYRRFFDVNSLIGLKTENDSVFANIHSKIFDLISSKKIQGLRVDHPDGLSDPIKYFKNLQTEIAKRLDTEFEVSKEKFLSSEKLPFYIVAEKILAPFERLYPEWAIHGTVGYEFIYNLTQVFLENKNAKKFSKIYYKFINKSIDFNELIIKSKKLIMKTALTSELSTLVNNLGCISQKYYAARDFTINNLRDGLIEIIACFPVYRTYISAQNKNEKNFDYIKWAVGMARKRSRSTDPSLYDFIEKVLLCDFETDKNSENYKEILNFTMKFQQYTAPLMAKGLEDTGFYNYNRLLALNEVGGNPVNFGISVNDFHNYNISRLNNTPHALTATSTHDTKCSEDVKARLCVLSEIPEIWHKKVIKFSRINKSKKIRIDEKLMPEKNDEYMFYQALLGIWPGSEMNTKGAEEICARLENYMIKAVREAKVYTSWININAEYEQALINFIKRVLNSHPSHLFWKEFLPFQKELSLRGYINSVSQILLKITSPGVPDFYQGNELWKYSLVDPDNRTPVDYASYQQVFNEIKPLLEREISDISVFFPLESGKLKLFIISALLNFRSNHSMLLKKGNYTPLFPIGEKADKIISFSRNFDNQTLITIVPRIFYDAVSKEKPFPVGEDIWADTQIIMPENLSQFCWQDILTKKYHHKTKVLKISDILDKMPVSVLISVKSK